MARASAKRSFDQIDAEANRRLEKQLDFLVKIPETISILAPIYQDERLLKRALKKNAKCYEYLPDTLKVKEWAVSTFFNVVMETDKSNCEPKDKYDVAGDFFATVPPHAEGYEQYASQLLALKGNEYARAFVRFADTPSTETPVYSRLLTQACILTPSILSFDSLSSYPGYEAVARAVVAAKPDAIEYVDSDAEFFKDLQAEISRAQIAANVFPEGALPMMYLRAGYDCFKAAIDAKPDLVVGYPGMEIADDGEADIALITEHVGRYVLETRKMPNLHPAAFDAVFVARNNLTNTLLSGAAGMNDADADAILDAMAKATAENIYLFFQYNDNEGGETFENVGDHSMGVLQGLDLNDAADITAAVKATTKRELEMRLAGLKKQAKPAPAASNGEPEGPAQG